MVAVGRPIKKNFLTTTQSVVEEGSERAGGADLQEPLWPLWAQQDCRAGRRVSAFGCVTVGKSLALSKPPLAFLTEVFRHGNFLSGLEFWALNM